MTAINEHAIPNLTEEQLINHLITIDRRDLRLSGIQNQHVIFRSQTSYPITNRTKAKYWVTARIPFDDIMFESENIIDHVGPSRVISHIQFVFDGYTDNSGIGKSQID